MLDVGLPMWWWTVLRGAVLPWIQDPFVCLNMGSTCVLGQGSAQQQQDLLQQERHDMQQQRDVLQQAITELQQQNDLPLAYKEHLQHTKSAIQQQRDVLQQAITA